MMSQEKSEILYLFFSSIYDEHVFVMMRKIFPVGVGCLMALTFVVSILRQQNRWADPFPTSKDGVVSDWSTKYYFSDNQKTESDLSIKGYLTRQEALRYPPLTDIQNVVSMQRSLTKIQGKSTIVQ